MDKYVQLLHRLYSVFYEFDVKVCLSHYSDLFDATVYKQISLYASTRNAKVNRALSPALLEYNREEKSCKGFDVFSGVLDDIPESTTYFSDVKSCVLCGSASMLKAIMSLLNVTLGDIVNKDRDLVYGVAEGIHRELVKEILNECLYLFRDDLHRCDCIVVCNLTD